MSYSSSFVSRIVPLALLAVAIAAGAAHIEAQTPEFGHSAAIGQLTIGDAASVPIFAVSSVVENVGGGAGGAAPAALSDIAIVKRADALSTPLFSAIVRGEHLPTVRIDLHEPGKATVAASFELADVVVTGFTTSGDQGEAVTFDFRRVTFSAAGQSFCWDTLSNTSC